MEKQLANSVAKKSSPEVVVESNEFTLENAQALHNALAKIFGERYGVEITATVRKREKPEAEPSAGESA